MSGHSKWSQIKRQKGTADVKRGAAFSKLTNAIIIAARSGGDPNTNFSLKMTIEKARTANMPKENIQRAIKRGTGEVTGAQVEEVLYEAIGHGGIGIIISAATDNRNRTNSEIKNVLTKVGGKLASSGAITYQFERMGKLLIDLADQNHEDLELKVIDAGARDLEEVDNVLLVYTDPRELENVKRSLEKDGVVVREPSLTWEPKTLIEISEKIEAEKILNLMDALENLDDVTAVFTNATLITNQNE
ncbi:MAG: transcriptional regulator [Berkelbacteria bacterium GW2011_GWA1_36_9]|uniref:Probable transcriptional regulatory protein US31_C0013G0021 n=1 Tax=Berkelbacteria bacterium GW2011_GWA1_36_9 TaxID=1618331 RepID=A0A0G0FFR1_9BACT|nr:MAG: transcriptional regulator [Berkelbacteria bacterium GW2011_GWA1_36_9]